MINEGIVYICKTEAVLLPGNEAASNITSNRSSIGMHLPNMVSGG